MVSFLLSSYAKDMIWQMRLCMQKSNKLLHNFSHCTTDVKLVLFDSYCTSLQDRRYFISGMKSIVKTYEIYLNV